MNRPTLKQLTYLIALSEEKSFSRAAEFCHVTQSTMSASIKELEDILEQTLVNRSGRHITLTPLGEEITHKAKKILEDVDEIIARAHLLQQPLSGILRLGIIPTIAPYLLPLILPQLKQAYPNLELQLHEDMTHRLLHMLEQSRLDAVLMAFPYNTEDFETHILFEETFVLASPKGRRVPGSLSIQDLTPDDLLLLEDGHCLRDQALIACHIKISNKRKIFSATSLPTLIQMVSHGYGVTLLPQMSVKNLPEDIQISHFKAPLPMRQIGFAWRKNYPQKRDLLTLYGMLKENWP